MSPKLPLPIFRPSLYLFPTRSSNPALPPELIASTLFFSIRFYPFLGVSNVASSGFRASVSSDSTLRSRASDRQLTRLRVRGAIPWSSVRPMRRVGVPFDGLNTRVGMRCARGFQAVVRRVVGVDGRLRAVRRGVSYRVRTDTKFWYVSGSFSYMDL